jgi:hypothetical protein
MLRSFNPAAMARNDVAPAARSSAMTGSGPVLGSEADTTVAAQFPPKGKPCEKIPQCEIRGALSCRAGRLRRAQTFLRTLGIEITFSREGRIGTRMIRMSRNTDNCVSTVSIVGAARSYGAQGDHASADGADDADANAPGLSIRAQDHFDDLCLVELCPIKTEVRLETDVAWEVLGALGAETDSSCVALDMSAD